MNPWNKQSVLTFFRDVMRFAVWMCLLLIGLMSSIFAVAFTYRFLTHTWSWCSRVMFTGKW